MNRYFTAAIVAISASLLLALAAAVVLFSRDLGQARTVSEQRMVATAQYVASQCEQAETMGETARRLWGRLSPPHDGWRTLRRWLVGRLFRGDLRPAGHFRRCFCRKFRPLKTVRAGRVGLLLSIPYPL